MNRTNRCYFSFSSRRMAFWGAHALQRAGEGILPSRTSQLLLWANKPTKKEKFAAAKCGNQHATSVRSPERFRRVIFIYQMNSEPNIASSGVTDPGYRPATPQPFYWSVWRELWENRSIYVAPILVAVVVLFGFLVSTIGLPERRREALLLDPATSASCNRSAV